MRYGVFSPLKTKKMPVRKNPVEEPEKPPFNPLKAHSSAKAFVDLQATIKKLTAEMNEYKEELRSYVDTHGSKGIDGSAYLELLASDGTNPIALNNSCRTTSSFTADILTVIKSELPEKVIDLIESIEVVRTDRLTELAPTLDAELSKKLFVLTDTYAFTAKPVKPVKAAAVKSTKKKRPE